MLDRSHFSFASIEVQYGHKHINQNLRLNIIALIHAFHEAYKYILQVLFLDVLFILPLHLHQFDFAWAIALFDWL